MARPNKQATPALDAAAVAGIQFEVLQYDHDPRHESYGVEAAEILGLDPGIVFKTLIVSFAAGGKAGRAGDAFAVAVLPVNRQLDLKAMGAALGVKNVSMAEHRAAERTTGYVVGGISPLGQKRLLPTVIHDSANDHDRIHVSAGRRGLEVGLAPADLALLTHGKFAPIG